MSYFNRVEREPYHHNHNHNHDHTTDDCVCNTVRNIIKAQDKVGDDSCSTSCDHAIHQLRRQGNKHGPQYNTIPFVLYCKGTCKPFIGSGIFKNRDHTHKKSFFDCVETPIFRAKHFVKNSECCVELELLVPASDGYDIKGHCKDKSRDVCSFFPEENAVSGFFATGICMTVDLDHFMGITCLDPINPM